MTPRYCLSGSAACTALAPCAPCHEALVLHVFPRALAAAGIVGRDPFEAARFVGAYVEGLGDVRTYFHLPEVEAAPTLNAGEETAFGGDWPTDVPAEQAVSITREEAEAVLAEAARMTEPLEEAAPDEALEEAHKRVGGAPLDPEVAAAVKTALAAEEQPPSSAAGDEGDDTKGT